MTTERLLVFDAHSEIHRAIHSHGAPLKAADGEPTRGTYIFSKVLIKLLNRLEPTMVAVAADAPRADTFRRKLAPTYKAGRSDAPPEGFVPQLKRIRQIIEAVGIPWITAEGFEADDVIATLVDAVKGEKVEVVIVTRDKDLHQLISKRVFMFNSQTNDYAGLDEVRAKWGVPPKRVVEVQTLWGDPSDNIPGVRGFGEKRAKDLIQQYGTVSNVYKHLDALPPKQREALEQAKKDGTLDLSRQLVTLRRDAPLEMDDKADIEWDAGRLEQARPIFRALGFRSLLMTSGEE